MGENPLIAAVREGDVEAVRSLLAQGADPDTVDGQGIPALCLAVAAYDEPLAEVLMGAGADRDAGWPMEAHPCCGPSTADRSPSRARCSTAAADTSQRPSSPNCWPVRGTGTRRAHSPSDDAGPGLRAGQSDCVPRASGSPRANIRQTVCNRLAECDSRTPGITDVLAGLLADEDDIVRIWAVFGLARRDDPRCLEGRPPTGEFDRTYWSWILDAADRYEQRQRERGTAAAAGQ